VKEPKTTCLKLVNTCQIFSLENYSIYEWWYLRIVLLVIYLLLLQSNAIWSSATHLTLSFILYFPVPPPHVFLQHFLEYNFSRFKEIVLRSLLVQDLYTFGLSGNEFAEPEISQTCTLYIHKNVKRDFQKSGQNFPRN
jgi:hypothetical protein